ncbi:hypothetical protein [Ferrimonas sp.]|uniref:hypothetical protein n=1 Tax=Ferrimonas sp. TaxID=2080861 RepID=UPI003A93DA9A
MDSLILFLVFAGLVLWGVGSVILNDSNKNKLKALYDKYVAKANKALDLGGVGDDSGMDDDTGSDSVDRRLEALQKELEQLKIQAERDRERIETLERLISGSGYQTREAFRQL